MAKQQKAPKQKTPPLAIPLPFDKAVEGLLKSTPSPRHQTKKKPATKKVAGKCKK